MQGDRQPATQHEANNRLVGRDPKPGREAIRSHHWRPQSDSGTVELKRTAGIVGHPSPSR